MRFKITCHPSDADRPKQLFAITLKQAKGLARDMAKSLPGVIVHVIRIEEVEVEAFSWDPVSKSFY